MTDTDRTVAHGMGNVAAPGHEEALADLAAENERLRAGMWYIARIIWEKTLTCPHHAIPEFGVQGGFEVAGGCDTSCDQLDRTVEDCWIEYYCEQGTKTTEVAGQ
jgi:hypothetical protein